MIASLLCFAILCFHAFVGFGNPISKPYIPFRTSPFDHSNLHHKLSWDDPVRGKNKVSSYEADSSIPDPKCPLKFSLGVSQQDHHSGKSAIVQPPIIFPAIPALGPGKQVIFTTLHEQLHLLTPASTTKGSIIKEGLIQQTEYPLLFESSLFLTAPLLRDVNSDGIVDVILTDYDGGIYAIGLQPSQSDGKRYFHKAQVPRMHVRRHWVESRINETLGIQADKTGDTHETEVVPVSMADDIPMDRYENKGKVHDPYHTYFEYTYGSSHEHEDILRGVPANILSQDHQHASRLEERRKRKIQHVTEATDSEPGGHFVDEPAIVENEALEHRRLLEEPSGDGDKPKSEGTELAGANPIPETDQGMHEQQEDAEAREHNVFEDDRAADEGDDIAVANPGDDFVFAQGDEGAKQTDIASPADSTDDHPRYDDAPVPGYGDDYYGRYDHRGRPDDYYDGKHYVRVPPHILCTPVAAELPKLYSQKGETEILLFLAVSYYFDEDEYEGFFSYKRFRDRDEGDETEVQRGMYVANAIMVYQYGDNPRWGRQEHLDMSADHSAPINTTLVGSIPLQQDNTKMGAFALGSPTVADIDGDGNLDVILGSSMGIVYVMEARNLFARDGWPVQLQKGIESRVIVEDVRGDTNLELFVSDVGGTITCLSHKGEKLWHRNLVDDVPDGTEVLAASPLVLGDVDGDGMLDLVQLIQVRHASGIGLLYLFVVSADSGNDVSFFPKRIDSTEITEKGDSEEFIVRKLAAPLLVDLHTDQSWLQKYIQRGEATFMKPPRANTEDAPPHGGPGIGLHIVFPVQNSVVVMEGASGCAQTISVGSEVSAMVQADDIHGSGGVDLVVTTSVGSVITLKSSTPFHPLNVWNRGETRGGMNTFAHGYSASQGIFVHRVSRDYRDIFGVYIPVTFEIFDNRPNIKNEPDKRVYIVEIRVGTSRSIFRKTYNSSGIYTERTYIPDGPGYYSLTASLKTTHGIVHEDTFHLGYNVDYMKGFGFMLWMPLLIASACILLCGTRKIHWDDESYDVLEGTGGQGILGHRLPE